MSWKTISRLISRKTEDGEKPKQAALLGVFRTYDARVQAVLSVALPPELAGRLEALLRAVPGLPKRSVVLTGVELFLEACQNTPGLAQQTVRALGLGSRGKVTVCVKIPMDLDERLEKFLAVNKISRRAAAAAGINLLLSKCEEINCGPFLAAEQKE